MKKIIITLLFLLSVKILANPFYKPNTMGYVGDTNHLFLGANSVYIHPLYNDILGGTDKLLTGAIKLGITQTNNDYSYNFMLSWRLLTPILKNYHSEKDFKTGVCSDSLEAKFDWSKVYEKGIIPLKFGFGLGINHLGNHGAYFLQEKLHKALSNKGVTYKDAYIGFFPSLEASISLLKTSLDTSKIFHQFTLGSNLNPGMLESYLSYNLVSSLFFQDPWLSLEFSLFYQHSSLLLKDQIKSIRYEISLGFLVSKYYKPSIKYISSYLKKDPKRQIFVDLINFQIPF